MWCPDCRQDVPGVFSGKLSEYACPRCGTRAGGEQGGGFGPQQPVAPRPAAATPSPPNRADEASDSSIPIDVDNPSRVDGPPEMDVWEMDERLRHIERLLQIDRASTESDPNRRVETSHAGANRWHVPLRQPASDSVLRYRRDATGRRWIQVLTLGILSVGLMATACGGVLLLWSVLAEQSELWNLGMPTILAGQVVLLFGLVLQLDRVWNDSRQTISKLRDVDHRLDDLNQTATLLGNTQGAGGTNFYAHIAGGANPRLLLADLKGQLDLLAIRLSQDDPP